MKRLLTLGILLLCWWARGATVATDGSLGDVQTKCANAANGDTLTLPSGTFPWGGTLSMTKCVSLIGQGRASTIISSSGTPINIQLTTNAVLSGAQIRIEGITFEGNNSSTILINFGGANGNNNSTVANAFTNLVIGKNTFRNMSTASGGAGAIYIAGQVHGVIYSNIFDRCAVAFRSLGINTLGSVSADWLNQTPSFGTVHQLFFEGNTVQNSSAFGAVDPGWTETGQGGRVVMRYNTWDDSNVNNGEVHDQHGFQNWPGGNGQDGTMCGEYYGNTYIATKGYSVMNQRGGWQLFFNNNYVNPVGTGNKYYISQYGQNDAGGSGCTADVPGAPGVFNGEVTNTYIFNNNINGSELTMSLNITGCGVAADRNWFIFNPSFTGASGIGRGTTPPTPSHAGVAYWSNSVATPTTSPSVIQNGKLYISFNGSSWNYAYTPYTYPHPLISSSGGVTPPSTNPATSISPASLSWTMNPSGGASNKTFTVQNLGGGTLTGSVSFASSPSQFTFVGTTAYSLGSNATATLTVQYTAPSSLVTSSNSIVFTDNGGGGSLTLDGHAPYVYIWPIGDSLTEGLPVPGGYRWPLYLLLTNSGINGWYVGNVSDYPTNMPSNWHDGYGGIELGPSANPNISDIVTTLYQGLQATPNYVLLMAGINDFRHNFDTLHATNRLENLIVKIAQLTPSSTIVVADLNPWQNLQPTNATMELLYNPFIPSVVARQALTNNVRLADMRYLISTNDLQTDNTHPTQRGYNIIGTNFFLAIQASNNPVPPTILSEPVGVTNFYGSTINLSVFASGTPTLSYQWRINSNAIGGASSAAYSKSNVSTNDQGWYDVLIANSYGSTSSIPAYVSLSANPNVPPGLVNNGVTGAQVSWNSMVLPITSSGANRMLLYYGYTYDAGGALVTNVTFNGSEQFTQLARTNYYDSFGEIHLWYLINPSLATANVLVNGDSLDEVAGRAMLVTNVNQSSPFEAVSMSFVQNGSPVTSDSLAPTQTTNELIIDALVSSGSLWNPSATLIGNITAPNGTFFCDSQAPGTSPATSMTWSGGSDMISHIAVAIKPAAGAPVVPPGVKVVIHGKMSIRGKGSIR